MIMRNAKSPIVALNDGRADHLTIDELKDAAMEAILIAEGKADGLPVDDLLKHL